MLGIMLNLLFHSVDYFIPQAEQLDTAERFRHRLLVGMILASQISILLFNMGFAISGANIEAVVTNVAITSSLLLFYSVLLYKIKQGSGFLLAAHFTVFLAFAGVIGGICVSGGPYQTSSTPLILISSVAAYLLIGRKQGVAWTLVGISSYLVLITLDHLGIEFIQMTDPNHIKSIATAHWLLGTIFIVTLVALYEHLNTILSDERDAEKKKFEYMALHDAMTGLPNRKLFHDHMAASMARADRNQQLIGLMLIDLNGFKPINDTYGHDAGDLILCNTANNLKQAVRANDLPARLGGDEFAIILENLQEQDIEIVANKILKAIDQPVNYNGQNIRVTGSVGISLYPLQTTSEDELIKWADIAMYEAKTQNKGWALANASLGNEAPIVKPVQNEAENRMNMLDGSLA